MNCDAASRYISTDDSVFFLGCYKLRMERTKLHWKCTHCRVESIILFEVEYLMFIKELSYISFLSLNSVTYMKN